MRVLVTGGAGFIGQWVARRLAMAGWTVVTLDLEEPVVPLAGTVHAIGDITDLNALRATMQEFGIEAVVHTVGLFTGTCAASPALALRVNVAGTVNVCEAAVALGLRRVVFTSSVNVYGPGRVAPVTEDHPLEPTTLYAATKAASESFGRAYADRHGLDFIALRVSMVYGPGKVRGSSAVSRLVEDARAGRPLEANVGGQPLDLLYVEDLAEAVFRALVAPVGGFRVFNVGSGRQSTVEDVVEILRGDFPDLPVRIIPGANLAGFPLLLPLDVQTIRQDLNWVPRFDLAAGIGRFLQQVRVEQ